MKRIVCILVVLFFASIGLKSMSGEPMDSAAWLKGNFENKELNIKLALNLYEADIEVPGLGFLGPTNGYMSGSGIYGVWIVVGHQIIEKGKATLRLSVDTGADSQSVELRQVSDSIVSYRAIGTNYVKKARGRKLVKTMSEFLLHRLPDK